MTPNLRNTLLLTLLAGGCAQVPRLEDRLVASEASVRTAQALGAKAVPAAAVELQVAVDELRDAKAQIENGDDRAATLELIRSKADADRAGVIAESDVETPVGGSAGLSQISGRSVSRGAVH